MKRSDYRGRFAPSPTGPLHFGSLVAAVGSYLEAKKYNGMWLVRMEDLDVPRCMPGAADDILHTLAAFGLHSDEPVLYQSQHTSAYEEALQQLRDSGAVYPCCCTRKEIADSALHGIEGAIYPGICRNGIPSGREGRAWRVRTDHFPSTLTGGGVVRFDDALQGHVTQHLASELGDFVVKRADGLFPYQLAVVVDDAFQNISHVVRGADLLYSTPRQIHLQHLLGLPTPQYMHLPIAVNESGEKLSKQTLATPVYKTNTAATLWRVLDFFQQRPPQSLIDGNLDAIWQWAHLNWQTDTLLGLSTLPAMLDVFPDRRHE
jgi:glutamyl-Q tRNA(Asp) synthetase